MLTVHDEPERRNISLKKVGVRNIAGFVSLGDERLLPSRFSLYAALGSDQRGVHMSRFAESLYWFVDELKGDLSQSGLYRLLVDLQNRHNYSVKVYAKARFEFPRVLTAPRTCLPSFDFTPIILEASFPDFSQILTVEATGFSCCPCALRESRGKGSHTQRCNLRVSVKCSSLESKSLSDFLGGLEDQFSARISSCLKRSDEASLVIHGFQNPKFVEDVARDTAKFLEQTYDEFAVVVNSFESIHKHDATAVFTKGTFR